MPGAVLAVTVVIAATLFFLYGNGGIGGAVTGNWTFGELQTLAQSAGFSATDSITAAAIAIAESSGNPNAYNPETAAGAPQGQGSFGLWQIYLNAHPEFAGENLYDPATNARAAFSVYTGAGNSFTPWSTFKNGQYASYLPQSTGESS